MINSEKTFVTANILPSYVECSQEGQLPGCLLDTDRPDDQCRRGRHGEILCDHARNNHAVKDTNLFP